MEIVIIKKNIHQFLLLCMAFLFIPLLSNSQTWTYQGGGKYKFNSVSPTENLSFFLYGDGYHSFQHKEFHDYKYSNLDPIHYSADPYEPEDVVEFVMPTIGQSTTTPAIVQVEMDNMVSLQRSWNLVEDKMNYFILKFENRELDAEPISGCIEFHYNDSKTSINNSEVLDYQFNGWVHSKDHTTSNYDGYTHKFTWKFDNLVSEEQRFIYFPADCLGEVFDQIDTRAVMKIDADPEDGEDPCDGFIQYSRGEDGSGSNQFAEIYTLKSRVSNNPHDPNMIEPTPHGLFLCLNSQVVNYKVTFQNDGEDAAENVYVRLNSNVIHENVKLLNASDDCYLNWGPNYIDIVFPQIYLPGMAGQPAPHNFLETIGDVEIEVCYKHANVDEPEIKMSGEIKFDLEDPISINCAIPKYDECTPLFTPDYPYGHEDPPFYKRFQCDSSPSQQWSGGLGTFGGGELHRSSEHDGHPNNLVIAPNPVDNWLNIDGLNSQADTYIYIYNAQGKLVMKEFLYHSTKNKVDVSRLNSGLYILNVEQDNTRSTHKFVKN